LTVCRWVRLRFGKVSKPYALCNTLTLEFNTLASSQNLPVLGIESGPTDAIPSSHSCSDAVCLLHFSGDREFILATSKGRFALRLVLADRLWMLFRFLDGRLEEMKVQLPWIAPAWLAAGREAGNDCPSVQGFHEPLLLQSTLNSQDKLLGRKRFHKIVVGSFLYAFLRHTDLVHSS
jgi:hypothetical protein